MLLAAYLLPFLFSVQSLAASIPPVPRDALDQCLPNCQIWSYVVQTCYQRYSIDPHTKGYAWSQEFLGCLCVGQNMTGVAEYGNTTMSTAASVCQACATTPNNIKQDLSTFLGLCVVQAKNGTAANGSTFAPLGYLTGLQANPEFSTSTGSSWALMKSASPYAIAGSLAVLGASVFTAL